MPVTPDLVIKVGDVEYRFDPKKILNAEAIAIEKAVELTWAQVMTGLNTGRLSAVTGVVWVLRKRDEPRLRFAEVVFEVGDVEIIDPDTDPRYAVQDDDEPEEIELPKEGPLPAAAI
jgi:hypothetical protein